MQRRGSLFCVPRKEPCCCLFSGTNDIFPIPGTALPAGIWGCCSCLCMRCDTSLSSKDQGKSLGRRIFYYRSKNRDRLKPQIHHLTRGRSGMYIQEKTNHQIRRTSSEPIHPQLHGLLCSVIYCSPSVTAFLELLIADISDAIRPQITCEMKSGFSCWDM